MSGVNYRPVLVSVAVTVLVTLLIVNFSGSEKLIKQRLAHAYSISDPQFVRSMGALLGPPLVGGNKAATLLNGDQIFPAMLAAIRTAKQSITFETYIYWSGEVGKQFVEALTERARNGVKVHVLLDWVGSQQMHEEYLDRLRGDGVEVIKYHPVRWYTLNRLNNRTHRKLLVIDGALGFTGGVGIADQWSGHAQDVEHWRDTHFQIQGPAVAQMQAAFTDNWTKVTGAVLHGDRYFPLLQPVGAQFAQVFKSSRDGGSESMHLMYLLSIAAARQSIDLSMSYFVPDATAHDALLAALRRGVVVRIIVPSDKGDAAVVRAASRAQWGPLLQAGAQIYEYLPTMFHCKVLVVDGLWVSVGSTNFDNRSFRLNDEANLNIYDREFARRQIEVFNGDLEVTRRVTYEQWAARPWSEKLWEHAMALFSSQL
jgi:cardiolipin synthase A/B